MINVWKNLKYISTFFEWWQSCWWRRYWMTKGGGCTVAAILSMIVMMMILSNDPWWTQQDWNIDTYSEKPLKSSASAADAGTVFVRKPICCFQQRLIAGFLQQKLTHCLVQKLKKLLFLSFWVIFARFLTWRHGWYQALWAFGESTLDMPKEWLLAKKLQPFWNIEYHWC